MTSLPNRPNAALLVIDVQVGVVASGFERDRVVRNIDDWVRKARAAKVPVIWVQHSDPWLERGSDDWQIVPELTPAIGEHVVHKTFSSSFEATDLEETLAKAGVGHLYICGAQTNFCIRHTTHASFERGYDVTLISDAHTTSDEEWEGVKVAAAAVIAEQNLGMSGYQLPGRKVVTQTTALTTF